MFFLKFLFIYFAELHYIHTQLLFRDMRDCITEVGNRRDMEYPSPKTDHKHQSRKMSSIHTINFSCLIILKFCTELFWVQFQNAWTT